jgi:UDP-galactopyranose mutase
MSSRAQHQSGEPPTLLCLAHLEWDHVWQRPQQLMTRHTRRYQVWYIDPPRLSEAVTAPELHDLGFRHGVRVMRPLFPSAQAAQPEGYWTAWHALLPDLVAQAGRNTVMWVFSPYADQLVERARSQIRLAVYDCMDDLASFKDGSPELRMREARLLELADLVFTGGRSMYEARKDRHPRVHCFPSGVDLEHYRQVREATLPVAPALAAIPRPRLGYFGVLDERIDWDLIATVAFRRPHWHWALVGPTAKVDPAELPRAANIHYLGQQAYADLPAFLKGFDVATMPFALNEATRYISPTKTLEYLAGGKWVLSSSVPDVAAFYHEIAAIADGAAAWIAAIENILQAGQAELQARLARAQPALEASTWDAIATRMADLIDAQLGLEARQLGV